MNLPTLTSEDVERIVKATLVQSALGATIEKSVNEALTGYNSPVKNAIASYIGRVASEVVQEHYADKIRSAVAAAIQAQMTDEFVNEIVAAATAKMIAAAKRDY